MTTTKLHRLERVFKVMVLTCTCPGADGVVIESESLLHLPQLEVEEGLVPVEVEAEVLPLAPLILRVGQEHRALPRPAGLLEPDWSTHSPISGPTPVLLCHKDTEKAKKCPRMALDAFSRVFMAEVGSATSDQSENRLGGSGPMRGEDWEDLDQ